MAEEVPRPNGEVKDGLFTELFGKDRSAKGNFISLYNALNGTTSGRRRRSWFPRRSATSCTWGSTTMWPCG